LGRLVVVTVSVGPVITTENVPLAFVPLESVTVTEMETVPAEVGVPETAPLDETLNPPPPEPDHTNPPVPPVAENCPEYPCPTWPGGREALITSGPGVTVMV
jgi:hypothetical protein